jgi:hypothetical protein
MALAQWAPSHDPSGWHRIPMYSNLPGNTLAITSSPKTQNFLAIASDETGSGDYGIFQLHHNQLSSGWDRVASLSLPGSVTDLIFKNDHFLVTGKNNTDYFIAVSSDSFNWDIVTSPKSETPFIGVGSDESAHTALLFPLSDKSLEYVTIGEQHFSQRSRSHPITSNHDMYLCIGSDGATTRTFYHSK